MSLDKDQEEEAETNLVSVIDLLEVRGAVIAITNVGVILKREAAIRFLDLVLGSARLTPRVE